MSFVLGKTYQSGMTRLKASLNCEANNLKVVKNTDKKAENKKSAKKEVK